MRIIHVSDTFAPVMGGIETQVARLATQQARAGHDVTVLTAAMADPTKGLPHSVGDGLVFDAEGAQLYTVARSQWQNPFGAPVDPHAAGRFIEYIRAQKPDAVHVHLGELTPVAMGVLAALKDGDIPTVASVHCIWSKFPTVPLYRGGAKLLDLYDAPILWLPNSELTASRVREVVNPDRVRVQNNSVDPAGWKTEPVPHDGLVAVTATRFALRKRVPALLRMLREVGEQLGLNGAGQRPRPLRVVVAGEGPGLKAAQTYLDRRGMSGWVELPGRLSKDALVELYSRSDIYLAPSVKDAFSISGLEARAAGLAILTRSQSGFGAAVLDGIEGRAVPTDRAMAAVLVEWARDPADVARYKDHNQAVEMPYSWKNALPQIERAYKDAAALHLSRM
ncbi:glycosyltransferase family 4 protein [Schaalia sp. JY-X169]|uniref:glycosyltransferase family 4 protein n=1 Tax=Schaalia sp. JY-X169 TaxID=2758572 RepID=UPI0015F51A5D|nr:glycosyltransferase family 4 protein [Schaalia sp. JY-X169]